MDWSYKSRDLNSNILEVLKLNPEKCITKTQGIKDYIEESLFKRATGSFVVVARWDSEVSIKRNIEDQYKWIDESSGTQILFTITTIICVAIITVIAVAEVAYRITRAIGIFSAKNRLAIICSSCC